MFGSEFTTYSTWRLTCETLILTFWGPRVAFEAVTLRIHKLLRFIKDSFCHCVTAVNCQPNFFNFFFYISQNSQFLHILW